MSQVRFQADWNLNHIIVQAAQRREPALDFQTAHAASLLGISAPDVLERAAREGRLLVTHDFHDMPQHVATFIQERTSAGVLLGTATSACCGGGGGSPPDLDSN